MYDIVATTSDLPILIMCRWNSNSDFERRMHNTFYISQEHLKSPKY